MSMPSSCAASAARRSTTAPASTSWRPACAAARTTSATPRKSFVILEGEVTLRVAGENVPVRAGDVIFIPPGPQYPHQFVNTSAAPMKYLSISTQERPEICEYPASEPVRCRQPALSCRAAARRQPRYWDGEP
jgi:uncharacterized cupin superfamily protein